MNCPYCRSANDPAESRCVRCGRRLHAPAARPAPENFPLSSGTALAYQEVPQASDDPAGASAAGTAPAMEPLTADSAEAQPSLFRESSSGPKVVPIPTLSPLRPQSPMDRETFRRNLVRQQQPKPMRGASDLQQALFQESEGAAPRAPEAIYCDALVAQPTQRIVAAAVDGANILVGSAVFIVVAVMMGVAVAFGSGLLYFGLAVVAVVAILYRSLWCLVNRDTPGMRFAGLRLVDFDGLTPERQKRIVRQFAGLLSVASAGVGLVWALVDEENLTWHDHISKTFPTSV